VEFLFLIKKAITFFIEPLGLVLTLLSVGVYFLYKSKDVKAKVFLSLGTFLLLFFSYPPIANGLIRQLENSYSKYTKMVNHIEYIHVLGGGHYENSDWPLSSQIGSASLKRTIEGISIFRAINNPSVKIIFTGYAGSRNLTTNAEINAKIARIANISEKNIIINGAPKDTKEEAAFAKTIIKDLPFILVTSASHMPRAIKLFENMKMNPIAAPTDFKGSSLNLLSLPNIGSFEKSRNAIHEFLGIAWTYLMRWN